MTMGHRADPAPRMTANDDVFGAPGRPPRPAPPVRPSASASWPGWKSRGELPGGAAPTGRRVRPQPEGVTDKECDRGGDKGPFFAQLFVVISILPRPTESRNPYVDPPLSLERVVAGR